MEDKERLDVVLHLRGLADSREKAKSIIRSGCVYIENICVDKPSHRVHKDIDITVKSCIDSYVSRGAYKLEKAFDMFNLDVRGRRAVDVGASTGGFTECLLRHGAAKVYAVDVGHDQLHQKLRDDKRVVSLEGINFRYADREIFGDAIDFVTADVSFISLRHIIPVIVEISRPFTEAVVLVKPQFEAGKNNVGKNGVVKDKKIHLLVLNSFHSLCKDNCLYIDNITYSPVRGGDGNIEYLAHIKTGTGNNDPCELFNSLIKEAFELL